jgi:hypothetical protein
VKWAALVELLRRLLDALERWRRERATTQRQAQRDAIERDPVGAARAHFGVRPAEPQAPAAHAADSDDIR